MYLSKYVGQPNEKISSILSPHTIFYDLFPFWTDLGCKPGITILQCNPKPDMEEIRELRVVDVPDIRWIGNNG